VVDPEGEIAAFCDSTNRWLPLLCTMNVTVATEMMRADFGYTHEQFENKAAKVPPGSEGCCSCPISKANARPTSPTAPA
jgi:xylulokinase